MITPQGSNNDYQCDETFLPDQLIQAFAETVPTPFYLYGAAEIRARMQMVQHAFSWHPAHRQFFPVKAAPTPGILQILREMGSGVLCTSEPELRIAEMAGFRGEEILFYANTPLPDAAEAAARLGTQLIFDGAEQLPFYATHGGLRDTVGIRLCMESDFRVDGVAVASRKHQKFGCGEKAIRRCITQLRSYGVRAVGLHAQFGVNIQKAGYYGAVTETLGRLAKQLQEELPIAFLDIGGGLGLGYREQFPDVDLEAEQAGIQEALYRNGMEQVPLYTELGRWTLGPCGILVTKVRQIREAAGRSTLFVDASAADLLRIMMFHAYHHVSLLGNHQRLDRQMYDIVGTMAEGTDRLAEDRLLPMVQKGDFLIIHNAGAYACGMGTHYCGHLGAAEYLCDESGNFRMIRRAETAEDYLATLRFESEHHQECASGNQ